MALANLLDCLIVFDESVVKTREQAIRAILERLASTGVVSMEAVPDIQASIIGGRSWARPESAKEWPSPTPGTQTIERSVGALAVSRRGLDFESLDRMPVFIVVLLLTPPGEAGEQAKTAAFDAVLRKMRERKLPA